MLLILVMTMPAHAESVYKRFNTAFHELEYQWPGPGELKQFKTMYSSELRSETSHGWEMLNMQSISDGNTRFIQEQPGSKTGRGLFAVNQSAATKPWLIQAPHSRSDKYTGKLAAQLFAEHPVKAVMWNSVPRKALIKSASGQGNADMAHLHGTYWQAATETFAQQFGSGRVIQLHGYNQSRRESVAARESSMIVSAGHQHPPFWVQAVVTCLQNSIDAAISLYPVDVRELGATTNAQNRLLQNMGFGGFLHIEMSLPMRKRLVKDKHLRQRLVQCIG